MSIEHMAEEQPAEPNVVISPEAKGEQPSKPGIIGRIFGGGEPKPQVLVQPGEQPPVATQPPEGVSPSVEAVRKAGYVETVVSQARWQSKPVEIRGQLGTLERREPPWVNQLPEWWPEELGVQKWLELSPDSWKRPAIGAFEAVKYYYNQRYEIPKAKEQEIARKNAAASKVLSEVAAQNKIAGLDARIALTRAQLEVADQERIQVTGNPEELNALIDRYDNLENRQEVLTKLEVDKHDKPPQYIMGLIPENRWEKLVDELKDIKDRGLPTVKSRIESLAGQGFFQGRQQLKTRLNADREYLERVKEQEDTDKEREIKGKPDSFELKLAQDLLKPPVPELDSLPSFKEVLELKNEDLLKWYFYDADERGIFDDLKKPLEDKFKHLVEIGRRQPGGYIDILPELLINTEENVSRLSLQEAVEKPISWETVRESVGQVDIPFEKYQGIRAKFVQMAYINMVRVLPGILKGEVVPVDVMLGELDINEIQDRIALEKQSEMFYKLTGFGTPELTGETVEEVRAGIENFLNSMLRASTTFDTQTILSTERYLLNAIEEKRGAIQRSGGLTVEEANDIILEISHYAENRMDYYVEHLLATYLRMDEFGGLYEQRAGVNGVPRLRDLPLMHNGKVALGIYFLLDPENNMVFNPQGYKGQFTGDVIAQHYFRARHLEQIQELLTNYDLADPNKIGKLKTCRSMEEFISLFKRREVTPKEALDQARDMYNLKLKAVGDKESTERKLEDLKAIKEARRRLNKAATKYLEAQREAKSALEIARQAIEVQGEGAYLGAPSIICENGDFINMNEAVLFYKFAIMQAGREAYENLGIADNLALITWRASQWLTSRALIPENQWEQYQNEQIESGKMTKQDMTDSRRTFRVRFKKPDGTNSFIDFKLQEGWEDTGLTNKEWEAFQNAVTMLRQNGFNAEINGVQFGDIIKRNDVKPFLNNYVATYKSSKDLVNNPVVIREARKGNDPVVLRWIEMLEATGGIKFSERMGVQGTEQETMNQFMEAITYSTFFHWTMNELAYWEASRKPGTGDNFDGPNPSRYSSENLSYGYQGLPWGVKRLHYLRAYWMTNERERIPRAINLVPFVPADLSSLAQETGFDNLLELIWNLDKEGIDEWVLMTYGMRTRDVQAIRMAGEGFIDQREMKKIHGFFEKLLNDDDKLWLLFQTGKIGLAPDDILLALNKNAPGISGSVKEEVVDAWIERNSRFVPIDTAAEDLNAFYRGALGSGIGMLRTLRVYHKFGRWLRLKTPEDFSRREQGGSTVYKENVGIHEIIWHPNSYRPGVSIEQRAGSKFTASHNPGLPSTPPEVTYLPAV